MQYGIIMSVANDNFKYYIFILVYIFQNFSKPGTETLLIYIIVSYLAPLSKTADCVSKESLLFCIALHT